MGRGIQVGVLVATWTTVGCSLISLDRFVGDEVETPADGSLGPRLDAEVADSSVLSTDVETASDASSDGSVPPVCSPACRDCKSLHEARPELPSGKYSVMSGGESALVYCDMVTEDGGWTLVARSVQGGTGPFGWTDDRGSLDDEQQPYSLGVAGFSFSEFLVGNYVAQKNWADRLYRVDVGPNFIATRPTSGASFAIDIVRGDCTANEIAMLDFWGYTSQPFRWSRDIATYESTWGLLANGFDLIYSDCRSGFLHGGQGMIFVR